MTRADKTEASVKPRVMVFCKAPVPNQVKTRLTPALSGEAAAQIHQSLATETLNDCLQLADVELELWCSPDCDHEFFKRYEARGFILFNQLGDDLGERMAAAFANRPDTPGILVGTDCPPIDQAYLERALASLSQTDVVLAPAEDGGYGLVGMSTARSDVFTDVAWSTSSVLAQTLENCEQAKLAVTQLPQIWDVDYPADVERWQAFTQNRCR